MADEAGGIMNIAIQSEPTSDVVVTTVATRLKRTDYAASRDYNEMVMSLMHQAANRGDAECQSKLGAMYAVGDGLPRDYRKAAHYLRLAADKENALALFNLGVLHSNGWDGDPQPELAFDCYSKSAQLGNADALNNLGVCFQHGRGCVRNLSQAFAKFREAAERGHAIALSNCGYMKELGLGTTIDVFEAHAYYKNAAERGCVDALYNLGRLCIFTETNLKDLESGLDWLLKAGVLGSGDGYNLLGCIEYKGFNVKRNYDRAREFFHLADRLGNAAAKNNLGWLYQHGYGIEADLEKALAYYRASAAQHYTGAYCNLGYLHFNGIGVAQDYAEALRYFRLAADGDNSTGLFNLAVLHLKADSGFYDPGKAAGLLKRCVLQGNAEAGELLKTLSSPRV